MDFSFDEAQEAVRGLADRIFADLATHQRLRELEADPDGDRFDRRLWGELAGAGLLGIALPESVGGAGLGFVETALVLEAAGRTAAYVPVVEVLAGGAAAIAAFGSEAQLQRWLPAVVTGSSLVTTALAGCGDLVSRASVSAEASPDGWTLTGAAPFVPSGMVADLAVVPARLPDGTPEVFVVALAAPGVTRERQVATTGRPEALVTFDSVPVDEGARLGSGGDGGAIVGSMVLRSTAALAVTEAGVVSAALALVSEYTKGREQFGKPIAAFQAVGQRAADAYVDAEAVRLSAWQAVWRIDQGLPAEDAVAVAKFWAADGGQRVVHAAVHLHGGVGVDRDYPLHRYFLLTEQIELTLGGATDQLLRLGAALAAEPA